jgi:hypothetical protein
MILRQRYLTMSSDFFQLNSLSSFEKYLEIF